jgi:hypothetical protein
MFDGAAASLPFSGFSLAGRNRYEEYPTPDVPFSGFSLAGRNRYEEYPTPDIVKGVQATSLVLPQVPC